MLKDITLGQFFPGSSVLHKLDPRLKLILTTLFITAVFLCGSFFSYGIMLLFLMVTVIVSGISVRVIFKGMKPLMFIIIFTTALNIFYTPGDVVWSFYFLKVSKEGLLTALFTVVRITMLITGTFVFLTYTTSPMALTDALERVMKPLNLIRVPVHELTMMMTIALRFIPTLIEETDKIMCAQKARGADFETGNLIKRAKALIPLLIPLFISAIRRAEDLAAAMECRCYSGGEGRTRMKVLKFSPADYTVLPLCLLVFTAASVLGRMGY